MGVGTSLKVLANDRVWRLAGSQAAGRAVARAAVDPADENTSTLAAMLLVRGGDRAVPLLEDLVAARHADPIIIDVLASIATPRATAVLDRLTRHDDPDVATAARTALHRLQPPNDRQGEDDDGGTP